MNLLKILLLAFTLFISIPSMTEAKNGDKNNEIELLDPLEGFSVSKDDIRASLKRLKSEGNISESDYNKALAELNKMDAGQVGAIKDKAVDMVRKNPEKAAELAKIKKD